MSRRPRPSSLRLHITRSHTLRTILLRIHTMAGPRGGVHPCRCASAIGAAAATAGDAMATGGMDIEAGAGMAMGATATGVAVAITGAAGHAAARVVGPGTEPHSFVASQAEKVASRVCDRGPSLPSCSPALP